ncbi:MAG: outer membrane protein assembly factor BamA [Bauldia sp.]|nr:outer membrane protein assembly factor BamA [Bauldia sp.]
MTSVRSIVWGATLAVVLFLASPFVGNVPFFGASEAQAAIASSIQVSGNRRIDSETIRTYMTFRVGQTFFEADLNASAIALYGTGLFRQVSVDSSGGTVIVVVTENPVVNSVTFVGNDRVDSDDLLELVETKARSILSDVRVQNDLERIRGAMRAANRAGGTVTVDIVDLTDNRVDVTFNLNEGERTGIANIEFEGNEAFADSRLRRVIQTRETNWLSWLTKRDAYDQARLDADQELLRRFYLTNGYADFRILGVSTDFDQVTGEYSVVFTVDEGPLYRYGAVTFDSTIPGLDVNRLNGALETRSGRVFDASEVERTLENVTVILAELGFPFAQVRPRGDRDYANNLITLTFLIDEGPRLYVERIDIIGNQKTRDYVIRREFLFAEGDAFNRVLVSKVERRLRELQLFERVAISAQPGSAPDRVVLLVEVVEQATGEFSASGGWSSASGFVAEVSISERNFLGRGQYVKLTYGIGEDSTTYEVSFTEPYFLGRRMPLGFDLYSRQRDLNSIRPFDQELVGGGLRLGLAISETIDFQVNYKYVNETVSNSTDPLLFPNGETSTSSLGFAATLSTLDSTIDPHEGFYLRLAMDYAGLGGDQTFLRSVGDARLYHEIVPNSDVVGLLRVQGGHIDGLGDPIALTENFYRGGETIRGFAPSGIGPRVTSGALSGTPVGGHTFIAATAEIQFPAPFIPEDLGLRMAVFADAATLYGVDVPAGFGDTISDSDAWRTSVGGSLLWASPFGLLRLDVAQALNKESFDEEQLIRFGIGSQF